MRHITPVHALATAVLLFGLAGLPSGAGAQSTVLEATTSTKEIFKNTVQAGPACFAWRPKGICFWLVCSITECHVETTLRVEHFTPDLTISTWHDPSTHPWKDYGGKIAQKTGRAGSWMLGKFGGTAASSLFGLDSAGTQAKVDTESRNYIYRGADAIGNPVNFIQGILSGDFGSGTGPESVPVPKPLELVQWFTQFPSQVAQQWATVPSTYTSGQLSYARKQTNDWSGALGLAGSAAGVAGKVMNTYNSAMEIYTTAGNLKGLADALGGSGTGSGSIPVGVGTSAADYLCPPGITPFGLAYQSDLDSLFWRGILPFEMIYPATWLPGMREVGQGLVQTWGSVWPRQGAIFLADPVKASAVLAQRVGDIVSYRAQPHIYSPLQLDTNPGYQFFGFQGIREHDKKHTVWQRVFPNPQKRCAVFGEDDSLSLTGFGDGHNLPTRGAVWNAWRRQDCCKRPGGASFFIGSISL